MDQAEQAVFFGRQSLVLKEFHNQVQLIFHPFQIVHVPFQPGRGEAFSGIDEADLLAVGHPAVLDVAFSHEAFEFGEVANFVAVFLLFLCVQRVCHDGHDEDGLFGPLVNHIRFFFDHGFLPHILLEFFR